MPKTMMSLVQFSKLLQILYRTPLDPSQWGEFLNELCSYTQASSGLLISSDYLLGLTVHSQGGDKLWSDEEVATYTNTFAAGDPYRFPMIQNGQLGLLDCEKLFPGDKLIQSDLYKLLLGPAGLFYPTAMLLSCSLQRMETVSFWRTHEQGPLKEDVNEVLRLLVPHIQAALEIRHSFGVADATIRGSHAMVDSSATPTFLLRSNGHLLHANTAARTLLETGNALRLRDNMITVTHPRNRDAFTRLLRDASDRGTLTWTTRPSLSLTLPGPTGNPSLYLIASPVSTTDFTEADVLLLAGDPTQTASHPNDRLRSSFGFTFAEAEVANGLMTGFTIEEIAALRRTTTGTIRNQVKSIFLKSGATRQSELVRILSALPRMSG